MATVMEEDFENEQLQIEGFDGILDEIDEERSKSQVEDVKLRHKYSEGGDSDSVSSTEDLTNRSSLIEKDGDSNLDSKIIHAITSSNLPSSLNSPCFFSSSSSSSSSSPSSKSSHSSPAKHSRLPKKSPPCSPSASTASLPFSFSNTTSSFSSSYSTSHSLSYSSSFLRKANKSFTLSMKDKFVTELCFFNPTSLSKSKMVNLGIFWATSRQFGDHFVYKISPLSPLSVLRLQPQDRLLKINGFSIASWSHNSVINFVQNLSLIQHSMATSPGKAAEFQFSLEYISHKTPTLSADQSPERQTVSLTVSMQPTGRMSVGRYTSTSNGIYCNRNESSVHALKIVGAKDLYINVEESWTDSCSPGETSSEDIAPLSVTIGQKISGNNSAQLIFHKYEMTSTEGGQLFAIETFRPGSFLYARNAINGSSLAVMSNVNGSDICNLNSSDSRLFRVYTDKASQPEGKCKIQNIGSGLYLKDSFPLITLVTAPSDGNFPDSMLFNILPYNS